MLSVSTVMGPMSPSAPGPASGTFNLQLQPGSAGALSQLMPAIAAEGATVAPTTIAGLYTVQGPTANMGQLAQDLSNDPAVEFADPVKTFQILTVPTDPDYVNGDQWQLNGTWGVNAPTAWSVTTGSDGVIVADVDTGLNYNNADIYDNVWLNQAEIPSTVMPNLTDVNSDSVITFNDLNNPVNQGAGKIEDTNGDGLITGADVLAPTSAGGWASGSTQDGDTMDPDDLIGWNFVNDTNNPMDDEGHGSFTAGEIGEMTNNTIGGAGLVWNTQIMPVKFLDSSGNGTDTAAAQAIDYAVAHGARVINASWGGVGTDPLLAAAIQTADAAGVIIVAAAGNDGADDDTTFFAPASYSAQYPNVISVAAIGSNGALASFSDYGVGTVQLAAPGVNVFSTNSTSGSYGLDSGTSMAAPMVTGTVALVEAAHPSWTMAQVIDAVVDTVTPDPRLAGKVTSGGVVNAGAAVANTDGPYIVSTTPNGSTNSLGGTSSFVVTFNEEINPATFTAADATLTEPGGVIVPASAVNAVAGSNDHQFAISFPAQTVVGTYTVTVSPGAQDWYGNAMNQNRNSVNGEAADGFTESIRLTDHLSVTGIPTSLTAGTPETFTVSALSPNGSVDPSYVGTINFTSTDSQVVLPANYVMTAANLGTQTFPVTFKTAGIQAITATDSSTPSIVGTEGNVTVTPATAQLLKVTGFPTPDTAGAAETVRVTAFDAFGNVATGYVGTVHFTSSDSQAVLPVNPTFTVPEQGTFSFAATLKTAGTQSITATDMHSSSISGTQSGIVVVAAAAHSLAVTGLPATVISGVPTSFTVTAFDLYGNVAVGYAGTVAFTSTDSSAILPANFPFTAGSGTHSFTATLKSLGTQTILATDTVTSSIAGSASTTVNNVTASASLVKSDATTEGNWQNAYGSQGHDIVSGTVSLPSYATVSTAGAATYTWTTTSSDTRALQTPGSNNRVAAAWYSGGSFTINLNLTDGQAHDIALYAVDWDSKGRSEQIQISSAATNAILDTETISSFSSGVYLQWNVTGNVIITVTTLAGPNALVNGLFFDPPTTAAASSASFIAKDTATQGNWQPVYGNSGYDIVSGPVNLPAFAAVTPAGASTYTWTTTSSDTRALQTPGSSNRVAAVWYASTSFTIAVNLTDGQAHDIALYALDWDNKGRSEQIQISSHSGAILDTETLSNFSGGAYLQWQVTGNVIITVTTLAGPNAIVDGLFLDPAATSVLASQLNVSAPTAETAGSPFNVTVTAENSNGIVAPGYTGTVQFTSSDVQAGLPASYTFVAADDGKHTFSATLKTAGTQSITATDMHSSSIFGTQSGIVVQAAAAHSLAVTGLPATVISGVPTSFTVTAFDLYGNVAVGYTGTVAFTSTDSSATLPGNFPFTSTYAGTHSFTATLKTAGTQTIFATDTVTSSIAGSATTTVNPVAASASLVSSNSTTEGNWQNVYGSQGHDIVSGTVSLPAYATVSTAGAATYTWTTTSSDTRALQTPGSNNRVAAAWYSGGSFTIDVNLTDGLAHDVALYALDWDSKGRSEQIQISSAATNAILDTETISSFSSGVYLQWNVTGNVIITVTTLAGPNAVVNGLFFDPPTAPASASASFIAKDTATQGTWQPVYGTSGYDIVSGPVNLPSFAAVTPAGASTYTWTTTSSDTRALQTPGSSNRVAAVWYASTSFTIAVNLTDGQAHDIALYALDWDNKGRSEQIQISSHSGAILDTETLSNFSGGAYLQWNVTGNVIITVTTLAGANAVVDGLFIDPPTSSGAAALATPGASGPGAATGPSSRLATDAIGVLDPPTATASSSSATALAAHDAILVDSPIENSGTLVTDKIGTAPSLGDGIVTLSPAADAVTLSGFSSRARLRRILGRS